VDPPFLKSVGSLEGFFPAGFPGEEEPFPVKDGEDLGFGPAGPPHRAPSYFLPLFFRPESTPCDLRGSVFPPLVAELALLVVPYR